MQYTLIHRVIDWWSTPFLLAALFCGAWFGTQLDILEENQENSLQSPRRDPHAGAEVSAGFDKWPKTGKPKVQICFFSSSLSLSLIPPVLFWHLFFISWDPSHSCQRKSFGFFFFFFKYEFHFFHTDILQVLTDKWGNRLQQVFFLIIQPSVWMCFLQQMCSRHCFWMLDFWRNRTPTLSMRSFCFMVLSWVMCE